MQKLTAVLFIALLGTGCQFISEGVARENACETLLVCKHGGFASEDKCKEALKKDKAYVTCVNDVKNNCQTIAKCKRS